MSANIYEIAPDIFRICIFMPEINLGFNHFLVRDEEPLLYHTGMRRMFPLVQEAVGRLIDVKKLRWISFSHFEADECGALNEWLDIAPKAEPVCSTVGALVNLQDFSSRPPRAMTPEETFTTGKYRFRYIPTAQLPHGWDAGVCFEQTQRTLFCSDLFHHDGNVEPLTEGDVLEKVRATLVAYQANPVLANYMPYTPNTGRLLAQLAELKPRTMAIMHGSSYRGDGERAIRELALVMREVLAEDSEASAAGRVA